MQITITRPQSWPTWLLPLLAAVLLVIGPGAPALAGAPQVDTPPAPVAAVQQPAADDSAGPAPIQQMRPLARVLLMPPEIELFSISGGGVMEPRADWTEAATRHFRTALRRHPGTLEGRLVEFDEAGLDEVGELHALHRAVAENIFLHHSGPKTVRLPSKQGRLDWTLGEAVAPLRQRGGADYALFTWLRDSYASAERKAAIIGMALLGVGLAGGAQIGYATLVDLRDGRVVWFGQLTRASGDLREAAPALETVNALLAGFPAAR